MHNKEETLVKESISLLSQKKSNNSFIVSAILTSVDYECICKVISDEKEKSSWKDKILDKRLDKNIPMYLFLTINTLNTDCEFDLNEVLKELNIKKVVIGLPDYLLKDYLENDPVLNFKEIYFFPEKYQRKLLEIYKKYYENTEKELENIEFYNKNRISENLIKYLSKEDINLNLKDLEMVNTREDLIKIISKMFNLKNKESTLLVNNALSNAFNQKYGNYSYSDDIRIVDKDWKEEFYKAIAELKIIDFSSKKIINVGVGSGNEANQIFNNCKDITFVDIADKGLKKIKEAHRNCRIINSAAEDLEQLKNNVYDIYISLRTYNSSLFNIKASLKEAQRVLKDDGKIIISVANGFLDKSNNKIIKGLILKGTKFINLYKSIDLAKNIHSILNELNFRGAKILFNGTDIYIIAKNIYKESKNPFFVKVLEYYKKLKTINLSLPESYNLINLYKKENVKKIKKVLEAFYKKYYNDNRKRYIVFGSSPARRGSALVGIPFENANNLYKDTGIMLEGFNVNKSSSDFLMEIIEEYGGRDTFYKDFYMSFICPIGLERLNSKGNKVNANFYETKELVKSLEDLIVEFLKIQMDFNIHKDVCFSIGSGDSYRFLIELNKKYNFFKKIIPLEHPRYIMQYNSKNKSFYKEKYLYIFRNKKEKE